MSQPSPVASTTYTINGGSSSPTTTTSKLTQNESSLIYKVKQASDSEALTTLVNNHSGIYVEIVSKYAQVYPNVIKRDDLVDDRMYNLYRFILDYDPAQGTKLGTYIGNRTDYLCKGLLKKDRLNPITAGTYGPGGPMSLGEGGETYTTGAGATVTIADDSPEGHVVDTANKDLQLEDIIAAAWQTCPDKRFVEILTYRHFHAPETCLSWREIGKRMGISHERARAIYNDNLAIIKKHLQDKDKAA